MTRPTSTTQNLKQYDAVFLDSTTGVLPRRSDRQGGDRRHAGRRCWTSSASGKGIAGIHASDRLVPRRPACPERPPAAGRLVADSAADAAAPATQSRAMLVSQGDKNADQKLSRDELTLACRRLVRQARSGEDRAGRAGRLRARGSPRLIAAARRARGRGGRSGAARARRPAALAGVQQDDRRLLQVPLGRSAGDHLQDRRSEEPADRDVQGRRRWSCTTRPTRSTRTRSRARTSTCSRASTTRR